MTETTSRALRNEMRCANAPCPRAADPGDAYCVSCGLELSLFSRRGGELGGGGRRETDSGSFEQPVR
jgi:hypothetical protein